MTTHDLPWYAEPVTVIRRCRRGFWMWELFGGDGGLRYAYGGYSTEQTARAVAAKVIERLNSGASR